jgi:C4-dicarboxylate transporter DctQ subunit
MAKSTNTTQSFAIGVMKKINAIMSWTEWTFIGGAMAFMSLLLFVNVIMRYVLLKPIAWADEVALYLLVWVVFIGGSVAIRTRGHIAIDLLPLILPPKARRWLAVAVQALTILFFIVFFWYSLQHTLRVRSIDQLTPILQAPMWLTYLAMPVGTFLMGLRSLQVLIETLVHEGPEKASMDLKD